MKFKSHWGWFRLAMKTACNSVLHVVTNKTHCCHSGGVSAFQISHLLCHNMTWQATFGQSVHWPNTIVTIPQWKWLELYWWDHWNRQDILKMVGIIFFVILMTSKEAVALLWEPLEELGSFPAQLHLDILWGHFLLVHVDFPGAITLQLLVNHFIAAKLQYFLHGILSFQLQAHKTLSIFCWFGRC